MERQVVDFEELFEERSDQPFTVACSIEIEHPARTQRDAQVVVPTGAQVANRQQGAQLLHALADWIALPNRSCESTQQIIALAQVLV